MEKYLVTGASGNIGQYVVEELLKLNKQVKAAVYNMDKAQKTFEDKENFELVKFDFLDKTSYESALEGVESIFLVRPPKLAKPKKTCFPF